SVPTRPPTAWTICTTCSPRSRMASAVISSPNRGPITGTTTCPEIPSAEKKEYLVPVEMRDEKGDIVAVCTLKTLVGPRKK
ncbi:MAG: hypothetical protein ACK4WH_15215, partial [Phycisphaerales bacterium]